MFLFRLRIQDMTSSPLHKELNEDIEDNIEANSEDIEGNQLDVEVGSTVANDDNSDNNEEIEDFSDLVDLTIDGRNKKRLFSSVLVSTKKTQVLIKSKDQMLSVLRNTFAYHRLTDAAKLVSVLVKDIRTPHYTILRSALILFTQNTSDSKLLLQFMRKISSFDINKKELILEIIIYFIRNNDRIGAKNIIELNQKALKSDAFRKNLIIDTYLKCFMSFIDYMEWKESVDERRYYGMAKHNTLMAEKVILSLTKIISEQNGFVFDIFVLILLEIYEYSERYIEAFDLLDIYMKNSNHLNAFIYFCNFSQKYSKHLTSELETNALKEVAKHSPDNPLVLKLVKRNVMTVEQNYHLLMEYIGYKPNLNDLNAWLLLKDLINSIKTEIIATKLKQIYEQKYAFFWVRLHCNCSTIKSMDQNYIELIRCKQEVISFFESSSHKFIIETNRMIEEYEIIGLQ